MFGISKGYALKVLFGTVFVLNICVASAQRPITSNQNRNQYGTLPGLNNQNQNQMQYGSIGGVQDNDAPEEEADTTKNRPRSASRWNPIFSTIRSAPGRVSRGT